MAEQSDATTASELAAEVQADAGGRSTDALRQVIVGLTERSPGIFYLPARRRRSVVSLLRRMMRRRSKPVHLVLDGLPAHRTTLVNPMLPRPTECSRSTFSPAMHLN